MAEFVAVHDSDICISAFPMRIELGKLREFARATGYSAGPVFDTDDPVILPTFLTTMVFWQPSGDKLPHVYLGFDERRVLHGEQEYVFSDIPIRAGDVLDVRIHVLPTMTKRGRRGGAMRFGSTVTNFRNAQGELVAQARTTVIETEKAP